MRDDVEQLSRLGPGLIVFDVSLPIGEMESYLEELRRDLSGPWPAHRFVTFGHMGDGNLHLAIASGSEAEEDRRKLEEIVYQPLSRRGGSVSAEHGIGLDKRAYLHLSRSDAEIALMRSLKRALDPRGILNPGRVLPPVEA